MGITLGKLDYQSVRPNYSGENGTHKRLLYSSKQVFWRIRGCRSHSVHRIFSLP